MFAKPLFVTILTGTVVLAGGSQIAEAQSDPRPLRPGIGRGSVEASTEPASAKAPVPQGAATPHPADPSPAPASEDPREAVLREVSAAPPVLEPLALAPSLASGFSDDPIVADMLLRPVQPNTTRPPSAVSSMDTVTSVGEPALAEETKPAEEEKTAAVMEVGIGTVQFGGLLQAWYMGGTGGDEASTFRLRRAELKFAGTILPVAQWTIMVDPAKALKVSNSYGRVGETQVVTDGRVSQGSLLLQDAFVTLRLGAVDLDAGQFRLPLSLEGGPQSSGKLETVERALFIDQGKYGSVRDLGMMLSGPLATDIDFQLGIFNGVGESQNSVDSNEQKPVAGRLVLQSALEGLQLGTSGVWSGAFAGESKRADRLGIEALFSRDAVMLKGEIMRGWDGDVERQGYYAHAGYRFGDTEAVVRYDVWDADSRSETAASDATRRDLLLGLNYYVLASNVKLQGNFIRRGFGGFEPARNLLLMNVQAAW